MNNLALFEGVSVAPTEATSHSTAPLHYACTSVTNSLGLRRHTLTTGNKALYHAFYEQVLNVDDCADVAASRGTFSIQFYANDAECDAVIVAALGGRA